jgi:hypothetical protein
MKPIILLPAGVGGKKILGQYEEKRRVFGEDAERRCRMGKRHLANRQVEVQVGLCVIP